jgi:hypothetical protein
MENALRKNAKHVVKTVFAQKTWLAVKVINVLTMLKLMEKHVVKKLNSQKKQL